MNSAGVLCVVLTFVVAFVASAPQYGKIEEKKHIPILKYNFGRNHEGYQYSYDTGNGIHADEIGYIKDGVDKDHKIVVKKGHITYVDDEGHPFSLSYIADEDGFHPQGDHLPTQPSPVESHEVQLPYQKDQEYELYHHH